MKFRELGGILSMQGGFFENERCCVSGMCLQRVDVWSRDLVDESRGVSEAASHREENAKNDLRSDIEGYGLEYGDCIKSGSG